MNDCRGGLVAGADDPADDSADDSRTERNKAAVIMMRGGITRRGGWCRGRRVMCDGLGVTVRGGAVMCAVAGFLRRSVSVVAVVLMRRFGSLMLRGIVASAIVVGAAVAARGGRRRSAERRADERGRHELDRLRHCRVLVHVAPTFLA